MEQKTFCFFPAYVLFKSELLIFQLDKQIPAGDSPRCAATGPPA
jgi:hypothetical protein